MLVEPDPTTLAHETRARLRRFRAEVSNGLRRPQKELPSKYFYDTRGSELFEAITRLDTYYLTRTETAIMQDNVAEMAAALGPDVFLVEYGSGNSVKTRILLDHLLQPAAYVPIDIAWSPLQQASLAIARRYPALEVLPVLADYTSMFELPRPARPARRRAVYFPGSTIGNFDPLPARQFLERVAGVAGPGGGLLIGIDLKKAPEVLHAAYNDAEGVTAAFNLNLLERINRELGADFDPGCFRHYAFYNPPAGRVEMHLVSLARQTVRLEPMAIEFEIGESIWTESSYKYNVAEFGALLEAAGFQIDAVWSDPRHWFGVLCCSVR